MSLESLAVSLPIPFLALDIFDSHLSYALRQNEIEDIDWFEIGNIGVLDCFDDLIIDNDGIDNIFKFILTSHGWNLISIIILR